MAPPDVPPVGPAVPVDVEPLGRAPTAGRDRRGAPARSNGVPADSRATSPWEPSRATRIGRTDLLAGRGRV